jgi:hypothetical protein
LGCRNGDEHRLRSSHAPPVERRERSVAPSIFLRRASCVALGNDESVISSKLGACCSSQPRRHTLSAPHFCWTAASPPDSSLASARTAVGLPWVVSPLWPPAGPARGHLSSCVARRTELTPVHAASCARRIRCSHCGSSSKTRRQGRPPPSGRARPAHPDPSRECASLSSSTGSPRSSKATPAPSTSRCRSRDRS